MPKISELTVADLRGARDMIEAHLRDVLRFNIVSRTEVEFQIHRSGICLRFFLGKSDDPCRAWVTEDAEWDGDWTEFMDKVWKQIAKVPRAEVREIRAVMTALGSAVEVLDKSRSEFAADLTARLKQCRDDAGARLIEYQGAAE